MQTIFWRKLKDICEERNTSPTGMCKAMGLATGNVTNWKRGIIPNTNIIKKIAEYFDVPADYFVAYDYHNSDKCEDNKPFPSEQEKDGTGLSNQLDGINGIVSMLLKYALFGTTDVSDELFDHVVEYARITKELEQRKS